jgi:hypothetical protein
MVDMPYFMEKNEWYYFDYELKKYVLTDKAPEKAKQSYKKYYDELSKDGD